MTRGNRYNKDKLPLHLVPTQLTEQVAQVLAFGAKKYSPNNWKKGLSVVDTLGSLERHLLEFKKGIDTDPESGLSHLGHIGCNLSFLMWMLENKPELDDREI